MSASTYGHGELRYELLALFSQRPRHGYEIIQLLHRPGPREYVPSAGAIYPRIAKLHSEGLIEEVATGRRRVFGITRQGREVLARSRPRHRGWADPLGSAADRHADIARNMLAQLQQFQDRMVEEVLLACSEGRADDGAPERLRAALDAATRSLTATSPESGDRRDQPAATNRIACHPRTGGTATSRESCTTVPPNRLDRRSL